MTQPIRKRGRPSRKDEIVSAAESLLQKRGLNGMTTRAIAEAVPCSEGAIYVHFNDRVSLILEVLHESLPDMLVPLHALAQNVGRGTPERNLVTALAGLLKFQTRVVPMLCSIMSEPELLDRFRKTLTAEGKGPHRGIATVANYIEQEQKLGRIDLEVDAKMAATVLMSCTLFHVFTERLLGSTARIDSKRLVQLAIRCSG